MLRNLFIPTVDFSKLISAIQQGRIENAKNLIRTGAKVYPNAFTDYFVKYIEGIAVLDVEFVKQLNSKGANPNALILGKTALMWLLSKPAQENEMERVRTIINVLVDAGTAIEAKHENKTAFDLAAENGFENDILNAIEVKKWAVKIR